MNTGILNDFKRTGKAILQDDSADSSNAVLVCPAQDIEASTVNNLLHISGGHLFVAISPSRADAFLLSNMGRPAVNNGFSASNPRGHYTATVSVEARQGVTTGISAHDRALTISILGSTQPDPRGLIKPGHVFPVVARQGGVLVKNTLPEGALDLVRIGDWTDAAVFMDLLDKNGEILKPLEQAALADELHIPLIKLSDLISFRLESEKLVYKVAEARLPSRLAGELRSCVYKSTIHSGEHLALVKGDIDPSKAILTRVQAESTFGDVFGGSNPPSRSQLHNSLKAIGENGSGVLIYLRRPDKGYLQKQVANWKQKPSRKSPAMMREYGLGAQILRDLGVKKIELLSESKSNLPGLDQFGIEIVSERTLRT